MDEYPLTQSVSKTTHEDHPLGSASTPHGSHRGIDFWMTFVAICMSLIVSALELTSVSTALPTIVHDLGASHFVWIAAAYSIASTAFIPLTGRFADIFGRKPTVIGVVLTFALGSALCGAAQSEAMLIGGRTVQGIGGGGIVNMASILTGDLIPLKDRGLYLGFIGLTYCVASSTGPIIGGALASAGNWRWLFYLNLPICGVSILLLVVFLKLRTAKRTVRNPITELDLVGNFLIVASYTAFALALTWGGVEFPWHSVKVLAPLILGILGVIGFLAYEELIATEPIVSSSLFSNRTSASGYLQDLISPIVVLAAVYFIPVYYQACKDASPISSGVRTLGFATISPAGLVGGVVVAVMQKYRPALWMGWSLAVIGCGLLSTVHAKTSSASVIGYTVILGIGTGFIYTVAQFPIQAPLPVTENARSLALHAYLRAFSGIWGITIGNSILQNRLQTQLPSEFLAQFPHRVSFVYTIIPVISGLDQPLKEQVQSAFGDGISLLWKVLAGLSAVGLIVSLAMREIPMHSQVDKNWVAGEEHVSHRV